MESTRNLAPILALWTERLPDDDAAAKRMFAEHYTEPVLVNGAPLGLDAMVARARAQFRAFSDLKVTVRYQVDTARETAVSFCQTGRHTGPLPTALGELPATGQAIERDVIDILIFDDSGARVREVRVVSDELGLLVRLGAVALK